MNKTLLRWLTPGIIGLIGACQPSSLPPTAPPPAPTPTAVTLYEIDTNHVSNHRTGHPSPSAILPDEPTPETPEPERCQEDEVDNTAAIRYDITAELDWDTRTVSVDQEIDYRNDTGSALSELAFYVDANKQPGIFTLESLSLPGQSAAPAATLVGVHLAVPLGRPLPPGCPQQVHLRYTVSLPRMGTGYFPRQGYLGYSDHQLNLGNWTVSLAYFKDGGWLTPVPINVGEQTVTPAADYHAELTLVNAPDNLTVVGPGTVHQNGSTWRFELASARDLTLSLSTEYHRLVASGPDDVQVELYTLNDALPPPDADYDAPAHALDTAVTALELYADLYGPYPYERLVILESDFPDGMEFSGLVFVGGEWFRSYHGDPAAYLTLITAHEVSHQWWHNIVANDQSAAPWLDEALATYSEYVFLEENYPRLTDWWWEFRVNAYSPQGYVDSTVYQFDSVRAYINAVYLRGARLMHGLRQDLGGEVFFQWLHDYVAAMRGRIATPADLWAALPSGAWEATASTRAAYLGNP